MAFLARFALDQKMFLYYEISPHKVLKEGLVSRLCLYTKNSSLRYTQDSSDAYSEAWQTSKIERFGLS